MKASDVHRMGQLREDRRASDRDDTTHDSATMRCTERRSSAALGGSHASPPSDRHRAMHASPRSAASSSARPGVSAHALAPECGPGRGVVETGRVSGLVRDARRPRSWRTPASWRSARRSSRRAATSAAASCCRFRPATTCSKATRAGYVSTYREPVRVQSSTHARTQHHVDAAGRGRCPNLQLDDSHCAHAISRGRSGICRDPCCATGPASSPEPATGRDRPARTRRCFGHDGRRGWRRRWPTPIFAAR